MQLTRKLIAFAGALFASLQAPTTCCELEASPKSLNVMSFNVRTTLANDPCDSGCWALRKGRVQQMLATHKPDLIGTQEGAPDQILFFQQDLGYSSVGECAGGECQWNERNSIFYKPARVELLASSTVALSGTPDDLRSNTWNLEYMRAAVIARFRDRVSGRTLCMLNTHFDINRGQLESSQLVAQLLSTTCQSDDSVFVTGDLNTLPDSSAVGYLVGATPLLGQYSPVPLYETLQAAGAGGSTWIGGSFGSQAVGKKIDYIFSRRDGFTCLQSGKVITDTFGGFSASDHAAVQSTFCLGTDCADCLS